MRIIDGVAVLLEGTAPQAVFALSLIQMPSAFVRLEEVTSRIVRHFTETNDHSTKSYFVFSQQLTEHPRVNLPQ